MKDDTIYFSADNNIIEEKEVLRDLGIMMNNTASFEDHIERVCKTVKQKSGWILRTFSWRKPHVLKLLWKQLVQPNIDYCSQLYMPVNGNKLNELENLQQHFTNRIPSANSMNYWMRLSHLEKAFTAKKTGEVPYYLYMEGSRRPSAKLWSGG